MQRICRGYVEDMQNICIHAKSHQHDLPHTEFIENLRLKIQRIQSKDDTPDIEDVDGINSDSDHDIDIANVSVTNQTEVLRKIWIQLIHIWHFQIEDTYRNYQE